MDVSTKNFDGEIHWEDFEEMRPAGTNSSGPAISVSEKGYINVNRKMLASMGTLQVRLLLSADRKTILLDERGDTFFRFPKNGRKKFTDFTRTVAQSGIPLPARYEAEYREKEQCWIAVYQQKGKTGQSPLEKELAKAVRGRKTK